jgi:hypothetical protein
MSPNMRTPGRFRVSIFLGSSKESLNEHVGIGEEWRDADILKARHLDDSYSVHVGSVWVKLLSGSDLCIEEEVVGFCTIIKWSNTLQLKQPFRVVIETELA